MQRIRQRWASDGGFTLAELVVVVAILGILLGIATPSILGSRSAAQDRLAQSNVRNTLAAGLTASLDPGQPSALPLSVFQEYMPSVTIVDYNTTSTASDQVSSIGGQCYAYGYTCGGGGFWVVATAMSSTGTCYSAYIPSALSGGSNAGSWLWKASTVGTCSSFSALSNAAGWTLPWVDLRNLETQTS